MEWLKGKSDSFRYHIAHPEINTRQYMQAKRMALGDQLLHQHRIYLDTKQWLQMRDVALGRPRNPLQSQIYSNLKSLRAAGKVICPISYSVFVELLTQSDDTTRLATARVIDELAQGCCVLPPHVLTATEVLYFIIDRGFNEYRTAQGLSKLKMPPLRSNIWTRIPFVFGETYPVSDALPKEQWGAVQRSLDDLFWQISVEELVAQYGPSKTSTRSSESSASLEEMEAGKRKHANDHTNFHDLFCAEVAGGLDAQQKLLQSAVDEWQRLTGKTQQMTRQERKQSGKMLANMIYSAFKFKRIASELPQIHIHASLHAALRWDKSRKYHRNDFEDIRHACVALPYFDTFCTERGLCHLLRQKLLRLDEIYRTKVLSNDEELHVHLLSVAG